ncbi:MAG: sialate O-acetylesterase [Planctomycetota bacterium]
MARHLISLTLVALALLAGRAAAEVELGTPFSDDMMVQMDRAIPVWGTAKAGAAVTVRMAEAAAEATADEEGYWRVELPAVAEAGPYELVVEADGSEAVRLTNVLAGDIWLCSGQSNMAWAVERTDSASWAIPNAADSDIRLLKVRRQSATEPVERIDATWAEAAPNTVRYFSAVGYHFGRQVHAETGRPIGLIDASWGGSAIHAWLPDETLRRYDDYDQLREMVARRTARAEEAFREWDEGGREGRRPGLNGGGPQHQLAALHNGMTHPLGAMPIRGVLWYQGEADAGNPDRYKVLFPELVDAWRSQFGDDELPVYFVQLTAFGRSGEDVWRRFRETQRELADLDHVEMAVSIDVGDETDIHPTNKQPVGERLARFALRDVYGQAVMADYPIPTSVAAQDDGSVRLTYDHVGDGLRLLEGDDVLGFVLVDADGKTHDATAQLVGPDSIVLSAEGVTEPALVRYAFSPAPAVNLVNSEDLPAVPFEMAVD